MTDRMTDDLVKQLRKEAARNAQMQGDKEHQTNRRRKTFRGRNRLFTAAADKITELKAQLTAIKALPDQWRTQAHWTKQAALIISARDQTTQSAGWLLALLNCADEQ